MPYVQNVKIITKDFKSSSIKKEHPVAFETLKIFNTICENIFSDIECYNKKSSPKIIQSKSDVVNMAEASVRHDLKLGNQEEENIQNIDHRIILDTAIAKAAYLMKIGSCDHISALLMNKILESRASFLYEDCNTDKSYQYYRYDISKGFQLDASHCVIILNIFSTNNFLDDELIASYTLDPWVLYKYDKNKKLYPNDGLYIISSQNYVLGEIFAHYYTVSLSADGEENVSYDKDNPGLKPYSINLKRYDEILLNPNNQKILLRANSKVWDNRDETYIPNISSYDNERINLYSRNNSLESLF